MADAQPLQPVVTIEGQGDAKKSSASDTLPVEGLLTRVSRAIDTHVIPALENLVDQSTDVTDAIERHCSTADVASVKTIENAFGKLVAAWAGAQHLRFGALRDAGRVSKIHFWPDPRGVTARQLRRVFHKHDPELLKPEVLANQSVALLGMGAIEYYLLFERSAFSDGAPQRSDDYECLYAREVARLIEAEARSVLKEWTKRGGWRDRLAKPGPEAEIYRSDKESAAQLVKSLLLGLELIREQNIVPLYDFASGKTQRAVVPFHRLGLTDEVIKAGLASLQQLDDALALSDFATGRTAWVEEWTKTAFNSIIRDAALIEVPEGQQLRAGDLDASILRKLRFYTNGLRQVIARQTAPSAGLTLGFNELDGD